MRKQLATVPLVFVVFSLCLASSTGAAPAAGLAAAPQAQLTRPNVLLILTDDQDLLLDSLAVMPALRALLADQGMTFENFFVPLPLCCPARVSLLRGQYVHNHQIYTNLPPTGGFATVTKLGLESATLATALQGAGYRTALLGKYMNGYPAADDPTYIPPGWDEWYSPITDSAYSNYWYRMNENGVIVNYRNQPQDYLTDVLARKATDFITRTAALPNPPPFFAEISVYAPHFPSTPAPRHATLFPDAQAPRTPSFDEADMSDKPPFMQALPPLSASDIQNIDQEYRLRLRSLQAVDEMIAAVVQTLQATGQLENTYIFFTSDNGYHMGQHRYLPGKGTPYEEDIRVPLVARGPGVPQGIVRRELGSLIDLTSTVAEIAGASLSLAADGRSLLPLLHSAAPAPSWRSAVFVESYPVASQLQSVITGVMEPPDQLDRQLARLDLILPNYSLLRTESYKYVERAGIEQELYNLVADPYELQNLAGQAEPIFLSQLSAWLHSLEVCAGDACRRADAIRPPFSCLLVTDIPVEECQALQALFNSTNGVQWQNNDGWLLAPTACSWRGVTCQAGHVTQLALAGNRLHGVIPPQLGNLTHLQRLDLSNPAGPAGSQLSGSLPAELGDLAALQSLSLAGHQLSGDVPAELGNLLDLQALDLSHNQFGGSLPHELTNLTLTDLRVADTDLCEPADDGFQDWLARVDHVESTDVPCSLVLGQAVQPAEGLVSQVMTYTLELRNVLPDLAIPSILLTETLPARVVYLSATPPPTFERGNSLVWSLLSLPPNSRRAITLRVQASKTPVQLFSQAAVVGGAGGKLRSRARYSTAVLPTTDLNGDRRVDEIDIGMIALCWRRLPGGRCPERYRIDGDSDIDVVDVQRVAGAWWMP